MARVNFAYERHRKGFYRRAYAVAVNLLIVSLCLTLLCVMWITYLYVEKPGQTYFSTNSAGFLAQLKPMDSPNRSSRPLLKPDPPEEAEIKTLDI